MNQETGTTSSSEQTPVAATIQTINPVTDEPITFEEMGVDVDVLRALTEMGFSQPMAVQKAVFRRMMSGGDLLVQSRTGSGKTAAFGIPLAQGLVSGASKTVQALILAPTRELALQSAKECERIGIYKKLAVAAVYGGAPIQKQVDQLKAGAQIVSGTPGRVLDHLRRGTLSLEGLKVLILDEADEMLSMGFYEEISEILSRCPPVAARQTVLFSATIPEDVERISRRHMKEPEKIQLSADFVGVADITHSYYMVSGMGRTRDLVRVLELERPDSAVIFCNTRDDTTLVSEHLRKNGHDAEAISSDLTQKDRERVMARMKAKNLKYLVATDIAARGIDISDLSHVINYTFPESAEVYVHRTGRTGRAGKKGAAISLISPRELGNFYMLKLTYKIKPEERTLPTEAEVLTRREAAKVEDLIKIVGTREPAAEYRALAKRLQTAADGERVIAVLIEERMARPTALPPSRPPIAPPVQSIEAMPEPGSTAAGSAERSPSMMSDGAAPIQDATPRPEARRSEPGAPRSGPDRGRGRGRQSDRPARSSAGATSAPAPQAKPAPANSAANGASNGAAKPTGTIDDSDGREFWEAWVDSKTDSDPASADSAESSSDVQPTAAPRAPQPLPPLAEGQVRLYLNLGRRDRMKEAEVRTLLEAHSVQVDSVEVRNSHTYLILPDANADAAATALSGQKHGRRDILCERARK